VLAAEPLFLLVDTAVVGHLGQVALAGLAAGGAVMSLLAARSSTEPRDGRLGSSERGVDLRR
jgi:hypothetical protein